MRNHFNHQNLCVLSAKCIRNRLELETGTQNIQFERIWHIKLNLDFHFTAEASLYCIKLWAKHMNFAHFPTYSPNKQTNNIFKITIFQLRYFFHIICFPPNFLDNFHWDSFQALHFHLYFPQSIQTLSNKPRTQNSNLAIHLLRELEELQLSAHLPNVPVKELALNTESPEISRSRCNTNNLRQSKPTSHALLQEEVGVINPLYFCSESLFDCTLSHTSHAVC